SAACPTFRTTTKPSPCATTRSTRRVASWPGTTTKSSGAARMSSYCAGVSEIRSTHVWSAHSQTNATDSSASRSNRSASSRMRSLIDRNRASFRARRASSDGTGRSSHDREPSLQAVHAVAGDGRAGELELDEGTGDVRGGEARSPDELVGGRGQVVDERRVDRSPCRDEPEDRQDVVGRRQRRGAELEERVRAGRERGADLAGHGEDLAALLEREIGRDQGTAPLARLHDDGRRAETRDDPVARRKPPRRRLDAGRVLRDEEPAARDVGGERAMGGRVVAV